MKGDRAGRVLPGVVLAVLSALAGVVAVYASRSVAAGIPAIEWPLVFLVLFVLVAACIRVCAAGRRSSGDVVKALRKVSEAAEVDWVAADGAGRELQAVALDLEERIGALRQDKLRAEMVLAHMADGIISIDSGGRITLFNRAAELMFDRVSADVAGKRLEDVDLHPEIARIAAECVAGRTVLQSEVRLSGVPERVIGIRASAFRGSGEVADSAMIILHDLSDVRRHEKNQKEFVSNVSHELRTPITSVRVTAEALLSGAKNDEEVVDRFLNTIVSESDRLSALIDDLMEIAKRDSGITKTEKTRVNIAEVIDRVAVIVRPQAEQKNVTLSASADPGCTGYCDETQIEQLVQNLVDNAVKYTPPGGRVAVAAHESGASLVVSVTDTGIGIPQGEVDRIFERFYRVDKARSRRLGGTGLGLSIVRDIVESCGGEITVETQLGKGSTFTVMLPSKGRE